MNKIIYLDTQNIKQGKNIISALIITYYNTPQILPSLNREIIFVKTQTLLDTDTKKVTIIGNLYYDKDLKIVGEPFKPFQIVSENNVHMIDTSKFYSAIFESCMNFLKKNQDKLKLKSDEIKSDEIGIKNKVSQNFVKNGKEKEQKTLLEINEYDIENETNVYRTIYTDGKMYCIQVSSWKEEFKAVKEVNRLKSEGHNAFYIKVNIPDKGTWYRVRVGFFKSLEEVKDYEKNLK